MADETFKECEKFLRKWAPSPERWHEISADLFKVVATAVRESLGQAATSLQDFLDRRRPN